MNVYNWATGRNRNHARSSSEARQAQPPAQPQSSGIYAAAPAPVAAAVPTSHVPHAAPPQEMRQPSYSSNVYAYAGTNGTRGTTGIYAPHQQSHQHSQSQAYPQQYYQPQQLQPQTSQPGYGLYPPPQPQPQPQLAQPRQSSSRQRAQSYPQPPAQHKRQQQPIHQSAPPPPVAPLQSVYSNGGLSAYSPQGKVDDGLFYATDFLLGCSMVIFQPATEKIVVVYERDRKYWFLPRGRKDVGETLEECALREAYEESGFRPTLLPLYTPTNAPHPPATLARAAKQKLALPGKELLTKTTEPIYVNMAYYRPKFSNDKRDIDPATGQRRLKRTGGEYLTFFYVGQIPADARGEPVSKTGMPDEQAYEAHLLSYAEAIKALKTSFPEERRVLERAWELWKRTQKWDEEFRAERAAKTRKSGGTRKGTASAAPSAGPSAANTPVEMSGPSAAAGPSHTAGPSAAAIGGGGGGGAWGADGGGGGGGGGGWTSGAESGRETDRETREARRKEKGKNKARFGATPTASTHTSRTPASSSHHLQEQQYSNPEYAENMAITEEPEHEPPPPRPGAAPTTPDYGTDTALPVPAPRSDSAGRDADGDGIGASGEFPLGGGEGGNSADGFEYQQDEYQPNDYQPNEGEGEGEGEGEDDFANYGPPPPEAFEEDGPSGGGAHEPMWGAPSGGVGGWPGGGDGGGGSWVSGGGGFGGGGFGGGGAGGNWSHGGGGDDENFVPPRPEDMDGFDGGDPGLGDDLGAPLYDDGGSPNPDAFGDAGPPELTGEGSAEAPNQGATGKKKKKEKEGVNADDGMKKAKKGGKKK